MATVKPACLFVYFFISLSTLIKCLRSHAQNGPVKLPLGLMAET